MDGPMICLEVQRESGRDRRGERGRREKDIEGERGEGEKRERESPQSVAPRNFAFFAAKGERECYISTYAYIYMYIDFSIIKCFKICKF